MVGLFDRMGFNKGGVMQELIDRIRLEGVHVGGGIVKLGEHNGQ